MSLYPDLHESSLNDHSAALPASFILFIWDDEIADGDTDADSDEKYDENRHNDTATRVRHLTSLSIFFVFSQKSRMKVSLVQCWRLRV